MSAPPSTANEKFTLDGLLEKGIWRTDVLYIKPRSSAELIHDALTGITKHKAVIVEPRFTVADSLEWREIYGYLSASLTRFIAPDPDVKQGPTPSALMQIIQSQEQLNKSFRRRSSEFHTDSTSVEGREQLFLMVTEVPAEIGGQTIFLPVDAVYDRLMNRAPLLLKDLLSEPIAFSPIDTSPVLSISPGGVTIRWNAKLASKFSRDSASHLVTTFASFLIEQDWSQHVFESPVAPGSASIWWDEVLLHKRHPELGARATRRNLLWGHRIQRSPLDTAPVPKPPRTISHTTVKSLAEQIQRQAEHQTSVGPFILGIDGPNASGKTTLAGLLAQQLTRTNLCTLVVGMDSFHNRRTHRYRYPGPYSFRDEYFDVDHLTSKVLLPLKSGNGTVFAEALSLGKEEYVTVIDFDAEKHSIVVLEGVFVQQPRIRPYLDYCVYLHAALPDLITDGISRWKEKHSLQMTLERFEDRYIPAQRQYIGQIRPFMTADIVLSRNRDGFDVLDPQSIEFGWPL